MDKVQTTMPIFVEAPARQLANIPLYLVNDTPAPVSKGRQESLTEAGQVNPIRLRPTADGRYDIVDGRRRVANLKAKGADEVEALVETVDDETADWHALILNMARSDSPMVEARLIGKLRARGYSQKQIAARLGLKGSSQSLISQRESLLNLIPALQDKLEREEMTFQAARYLVRKKFVLPVAIQEQLALLPRITIVEAREALRQFQADEVDLSSIDIPMDAPTPFVRLSREQVLALTEGQPIIVKIGNQEIVISSEEL